MRTIPAAVTLWSCQFVLPVELVEDTPVLDMATAMQLEAARAEAGAAGYDLIGEPEITREPGVWLPDWHDEEPRLVGLDVARLAGYTGEATIVFFRYVWTATKR